MTAPAYLVRSDDPSLLSDAVSELVRTLVGDGDPGLVVEEIALDAPEGGGVAALLDACLTPPFLTDRRVVVGRNAGGLSGEDAARIIEYLAQPLDTSVLVLVAGGGTIPPKLVAEVKKCGEVRERNVPRAGRDRTSWVTERVKAAAVNLDADATAALGEHLGEDLGRLRSIIETLTSAFGPGARLSRVDIEPFLGDEGAAAPWDLTDAIDRADQGTALSVLHRMLAAGDRHPLVIMSTLHRHFSSMLRLDGSGARTDAEAAEILGLKSAFPAKKALAQARRLGSARIRRAIELLADADLDLRGAKGWPEDVVMEVLVARLCQLSRA